jgi:hypothetical protein
MNRFSDLPKNHLYRLTRLDISAKINQRQFVIRALLTPVEVPNVPFGILKLHQGLLLHQFVSFDSPVYAIIDLEQFRYSFRIVGLLFTHSLNFGLSALQRICKLLIKMLPPTYNLNRHDSLQNVTFRHCIALFVLLQPFFQQSSFADLAYLRCLFGSRFYTSCRSRPLPS